jgi:hypothetical protein
VLVNAAVTGCPQFVQKLVPDSSLLPQFVQNAVSKLVAAASTVDGASAATA